MRLPSPEIPIIKSPTTVGKKGKHIGRPVGSKNKEKKKIKLASQKSTTKPAQSSQTDAASSLPSKFQRLIICKRQLYLFLSVESICLIC